ncbi:MAG: 4Fe-4S binding protein [Coriobacteriales bacterium]|nr:4Fe-4S binding protein [Coriobacteriales bacterium]
MSVFSLKGTTLKSLFKKAPTRKYPFEVREPFERTCGSIKMVKIKECILCGLCEKKCPCLAITVDKSLETWSLRPFECIVCGECVDACPKNCIEIDIHYTPINTQKTQLDVKKPPLSPEELAEKEKKEKDKQAKIAAAKAAKATKEASSSDKNTVQAD